MERRLRMHGCQDASSRALTELRMQVPWIRIATRERSVGQRPKHRRGRTQETHRKGTKYRVLIRSPGRMGRIAPRIERLRNGVEIHKHVARRRVVPN